MPDEVNLEATEDRKRDEIVITDGQNKIVVSGEDALALNAKILSAYNRLRKRKWFTW